MKSVGFEQRRGAFFHLFTAQQAEAARLAANKQVVRHRHVGQQVNFLVYGADTKLLRVRGVARPHGLAAEINGAAIGLINAGERFNERRFSGPVFPEQRHDLPAPQAEIDMVERLYTGERFAQAFRSQDFLMVVVIHGRTLLLPEPGVLRLA
ncbi:conserved hypothetical protein [Cronobacter sakazakii 696]|nr:conserved hypothetical protein [Cronobacter sakazakii 701]CCK08543.1 conserved hypothetical protein [Cronobacter sakazakii 696]